MLRQEAAARTKRGKDASLAMAGKVVNWDLTA
jgi:hypothetical protein